MDAKRFQTIPLSFIDNNEGQIPGVPPNPRKFTPRAMRKLVRSIQQDPEMLELRALLVYPLGERFVSIGGNMRTLALKSLGYENAPCVVIPAETPAAKLKRYIIKDNSGFGDWDRDMLMEFYETSDLDSWCVDIPQPTEEDVRNSGISAWNDKERPEKRCDMTDCLALHTKGNLSFVSMFRTSDEGDSLTDIKSDFSNAKRFAASAEQVLRNLVGFSDTEGWCIVTTPKRRHKERNFAETVCIDLSERLGITFHADAVTCENRQRVNPVFKLEYFIPERNIVLFDDIVTTGMTLTETRRLLAHKNVVTIVGIYNR